MCDLTQISRATAENGIEQVWITPPRYFFEVAGVVNYLKRYDVVAKEAKAATQLPIPARLDVASKVYVDALSVWHEYLVFL
ncbi:hypothetical protein GJ744_008887 [Endocarpon pusillum]|uniref:Uncharacterized protein n=1 Tax=Endocarpon pusillum TaxID=364733 RepID=A0A8H7AQP2_9EURO|nr:hypothetical protein GJ744_008887 [Endocarpon pusillum]